MSDLTEPKEDNECFKRAVKHFKIPEKNQIELYDPNFKKVQHEMLKLQKRLKEQDGKKNKKKFLIIYIAAGHGMMMDSK